MTVRHHLKKHRTKIAVTLPIAFLLASSLSLVRNPDEMCLMSEDNRYVEVGEEVTIQIIADADEPINVIGATITAPPELISISSISRENSIIDLWTQEPSITDNNAVTFSGGIVTSSGFTGNGTVLSFTVVPTAEGVAEIDFSDSQMLAHDGTGMPVSCSNSAIVLTIRPQEHPSPDVNGDKTVNLFDFGIVSARLFMAYERPYDLNLDGKITISDIGVLISNMRSSSNLGSLAVGWI